MERQEDYHVESAPAPIVLNAGRRVIVPLAEGTAASVQVWGDGAYDILVSQRVSSRYQRTVAHHAMSHLVGDLENGCDVIVWCRRESCWAARAWLLIPHVQTAAGL